ncbi:hypothetical protein HELRODRAFT_155577 [Helobdella robusta]|uniref:AAA+ ATPase domain-containing protein n=1 Tax=Helobdella robusta TaxID=6412 RepID=T1ELJ0_HELRO|nr:hypothetical protein HELRODRAFT_155577 [Helobdella robusta]ESO12478.1 hypothetical protein HELRODRAFT_155577 [Helobdella robusta]
MASATETAEAVDQRIEFIGDYISKTMKLRSERWNRLYSVEENKQMILDFFEKSDRTSLIFSINISGVLTVSFSWPTTSKTKCVYFFKKSNEIIGKEPGWRQKIIFGDIGQSPIQQFSLFLEEVMLPILSNKKNCETWPRVIYEDIMQNVQELSSAAYVLSGLVKGRTLLPLPYNMPSSINALQYTSARKLTAQSQQLVHDMETLVIEWSNQIYEVLQKESDEPLIENLNPTPYVEIEFWESRYLNLDCINDQLKCQKIEIMSEILERSYSVYNPLFVKLKKDVSEACEEARDICLFLKPLRLSLDDLEQVDFYDLSGKLSILMHTVFTIWCHSKFYNTPEKAITLFQEICNMLITKCRVYLDPHELFKGEAEETAEKVDLTIKNMKSFKTIYSIYKGKVREKAQNTPGMKDWEFPLHLIFHRYDLFYKRVSDIMEVFSLQLEFMKLEKIEFSGHKGGSLGNARKRIYEEFKESFKEFVDLQCDILDPSDQGFEKQHRTLKRVVEDLDVRLATLICLGLDDANGLEGVFKLLDSLGTLLDRPTIKNDVDEKLPDIIKQMDDFLSETKQLYDDQINDIKSSGKVDLHVSMPKMSSHLEWAKGLKERIAIHMTYFKRIEFSKDVSDVNAHYEEMIGLLNKFINDVKAEWLSTVGNTCHDNLKKFLSASHLYGRNEELWRFKTCLDLITQWYNEVKEALLEVEYPLIEEQLVVADKQLELAEKHYTWETAGAWEFITETKKCVSELNKKLFQTKANVDQMKKIMTTWSKTPLFDRSEGKTSTLLNISDKEDKLKKRYSELSQAGIKIHQLVRDNLQLFGCSEQSDEWKAYVDFLDEMIVESFFLIIQCSLHFLQNNTVPLDGPAPLFETTMELQAPDIIFIPSMDEGVADGFFEIVDNLICDIYKQASVISRLSTECGIANYQPDAESSEDLNKMRCDLMEHVNNMMLRAADFKQSFDSYVYLWTDDRAEFLKQFLLYNHVLTAEEIEAHGGDGIPENPPTLQQFKDQIDHYEHLYKEVESIDGVVVFENWFRIDARPFKQSLLNTIKKWALMFKQHLVSHVTTSLKELNDFIKVVGKGLSQQVKEGDYDELIQVMGHLLSVKERQGSTDAMFEPLKESIELLKAYSQDVTDEVHLQLQELPEQWGNIKKLALTVKQQVAPLQANEVANLRKKTASFDVQQQEFRENFRKMPAYNYSCHNPYDVLNEYQLKLTTIEKTMTSLVTSASLFEVAIPDFKHIKLCRRDIVLLKVLWDYVFCIRSTFDDWKTTLWKRINVEHMELESKKLTKVIRTLDKEMKPWDVFIGLDNTIKNMTTSLTAVNQLQNSAIRERHWMQLMRATGVRFTFDDKTTLSDLLSLKLHNFEDEVKNIVDKSVKELSMEKMLNSIHESWTDMQFEHEKHPRTGITLLKASETLIETLEENQVQLQNMLTSKHIAHFLEEVSTWQKKLSTADQVISIWFEVQRTWSHLESIFIGSDDIRTQLPQDSERFDKIDVDFKELVKEVETTTQVLETTSRPRLYERLETIKDQLTLCEKALAEYLETKRLAFPRFYFVSAVDLLDILSNGNQPSLVTRHLTKLFDSMAQLKFDDGKLSADDGVARTAIAMWSKDDEFVHLSSPCDCSGQVEVWLNRLLSCMRQTIRYELTEALAASEEKMREQWLFEFPAQVALCCVQISQLNVLITMLTGTLTPGDRQKIMTVCTIEVHNRDVVNKLIAQKVENSQAFTWLSQLRHRWDDKEEDCFANICDAQFKYSHEYLGNSTRLVITPLTDRCYITLTQSLHLTMSGAPAGPAGTGKTETTKDLGRTLGVMVYVFNCSEQMDYKSIGNIYKGLAQSGAWGCFDEFNRISVEVLSVVAVQVKCIQDAIKSKKKVFSFLGEEISLMSCVGIFITMNPGYAGRTELPENLKALFRPCAMVVPDFELICEIMLVAEGFLDARLLARKFITLYSLCKELLSKQDHYDWGLRAIKSVLVVAGSLKRGDKERPEDQVLMRALRDFNIPKIVTDDMPVFMGLIGDLFPALDVPRKRDDVLEKQIKTAISNLKLQPEDGFILKVVQLQELFEVRHSVFIVGNAGTGKSCVWKTLYKANQNMKKKPIAVDLNPKAVTNNELFGIINPATREWKDGLFSYVMRDLANNSHDGPKWIILDGDIDPMWIESLNTVMDDNKVLTLASNERIPLTHSMRLLFEISHLKSATPATVSRAGILYINAGDLGWNPFISSWIETRQAQSEKANLTILFDKYVPSCLEAMRLRFKKIIPITDISHLQMLCYLLECMLTPENTPADCPKEWYELYFVFSCIWAFGGCLFQDQLVDHRVEFTKWWVGEFKTIKFPAQGTVFDYYIDQETKKFELWSKKVPKFELDSEIPLQATMVHTSETTRIRYFLDLLLDKRRPVMLVGHAGTGKTVLINDKIVSLSEDFVVANVPFNFYTTSEMLQQILEKPLEKKAGKNYGPPGNKKLIYFIDDMNMPERDRFSTVQPHTLIRQHLDYNHWYDRTKLTLKEISNTQYVACMNQAAGNFTIDTRLQRHFSVFALSFPSQEALTSIYTNIIQQHLLEVGFPASVQKQCNNVVQASLLLHQRITQTFQLTAIKFHYIFNLRDLSNVFQGILFAGLECCKVASDLARLWVHESQRTYRDKLVSHSDLELFDKIIAEVVKKIFEDLDENAIFKEPLQFCHFASGIGEPKYLPVVSSADISKILIDALENYNEINSAMNLVLFDDAISHVLRINRITEAPRGNALLVGVGGSGKQSLSKLAAHISGYEVFQITLKKGYGIPDLKQDLNGLYQKAGLKGLGMVLLMTDAHIIDERFLVLINDLLASGEIPDLFTEDDLDIIVTGVRNDVKEMGLFDSRENCWKFFIDRVRRQLKVILCFSPVGNTLRVRSRNFPALTNCTSIDWFHEWPEEALISVSHRFLSEIELLDSGMRQSISQFVAYVHRSVNQVSEIYLQNERRYNYTTPKSFLELIQLYQNLLAKKHENLQASVLRLETGLEKLKGSSSQVESLKLKLAQQKQELAIKDEQANKLINVVEADTIKVSKEKSLASEEEKKVQVINEEVQRRFKECQEDLAKAEPALIEAKEALATLNKSNLSELKGFAKPVTAVVNVTAAVMVLLANKTKKIPKDRTWNAAKVMMGKVDDFLNALLNYEKENIPDVCRQAVQPYLQNPEFNAESIKQKSVAAAGLCKWVINIMKYYAVYCDVEPKRQALNQATQTRQAAEERLQHIQSKIASLEEALSKLKAEYDQATEAQIKCKQEADATNKTIILANRLVSGLTSENDRWTEQVKHFRRQETTLAGDMLLVAAFISYIGCFTKQYRLMLIEKHWIPFLTDKLEVSIPFSEGFDPLSLLTDDAQVASWNNCGLPSDRMSTENAAILINSERWPLIIDPQLQGLKWIKSQYSSSLVAVRLGQKGFLDRIEQAISNGDTVLIENIEETLDPVLEPVIARNLIKKGTAIRFGDKEVEYDKGFRLILHTKLANPHYKPELQAQTTLINFTVTRDGLEDQLLADVVSKERYDLEKSKASLTKSQNTFKISLKNLEDELLARLSTAEANFLGDYALVENLEKTKSMSSDIELKVAEAKVTESRINEAREAYRKAATRASLLYFILNDLNKIHPMYQFSLKAFSIVFEKAIDRAEPAEETPQRVQNLIDCITYSVFIYTSRGLFERDKLTFMAQTAFQILNMNQDIDPQELDFLLRLPALPNVVSPVDFLNNQCWGAVKALALLDEFNNLDRDIEGSTKRWKKFVESEYPEKEKFPQEWKNKSSLQRMCMLRCLRPDRMTYAVKLFVEEKLGSKFVETRSLDFSKSFEESGSGTPVMFILSPGVDPLKDVETLGVKLGFSVDKSNFHNISLGQGQEVVAEDAMEKASKSGHWVVLQNIHLVSRWLPALEKLLEQYSLESHADFRVFISAEPAPTKESHIIPQGILEAAIKITNEPPTGMFANLHKALDNFSQDTLEMCAREAEFKSILFSLCYFHAVVSERRKFGPQGWNRIYPFNTGDLTISINVLFNYLEANAKVPWEDLRYLFGEIMYGGHITDDWDRRLCKTYLEEYMNPSLLDGEMNFAPGFPVPPNTDYRGYHSFITECLPSESPHLYGLHPNSEIEFLTMTSENLFRTVLEMQPRDSGMANPLGLTREDKIKNVLDEILEKIPEEFVMYDLIAKLPPEDRTPYVTVAFQECERMNLLTLEIKRSLKELDLGLKGELTITADMELLGNALFLDMVPDSWIHLAYPSLYGLAQWHADLVSRIKELESWVSDFQLPSSVWLGGFFNPQSFLTAIMQQMARKNEWPLDKMCLQCDVTKKNKEDMGAPPREGSYVHGLYMEGARWDVQTGLIAEARLKELAPMMPVIFIKAIPVDRQDLRNIYECPTYKTKQRGNTFVWTFNLKSKEKPAKWILAGVALTLQVIFSFFWFIFRKFEYKRKEK